MKYLLLILGQVTIAGGSVYVLNKPAVITKSETPEIECPGEQFIAEAGLKWTREYDEKYPDSTMEEKIADWNKMLVAMKCEEYQVSIDDVYYSGLLSDLLHSTTTDTTVCPTQEESLEVYEHWFNYFVRAYPTSTDKAVMEGWDELMVQNGCMGHLEPSR